MEKHLKGINVPASKRDLIRHAEGRNGPEDVRRVLQRVPERKHRSAADVANGIGQAEQTLDQGGRSARGGHVRTPMNRNGLTCRMCGATALHDLGVVKKHRFVECRECAFTFAPAAIQADRDRRYRAGYADDGPEPPQWARSLRFLEPALRRLPPPPKCSVLDFGAGNSPVPEMLRERDYRTLTIDLAPRKNPHPDDRVGCILSLDLPEAPFNLVYSYQVFEHLAEPAPYIERLLQLIRPQGYLLIHTDMEMPERMAGFHQWWYVLPPEHCSFYRHRTFEHFFARSPHAIVRKTSKSVLVQIGGA